MKAVAVVTGRAVPLDRSDVDTDQIIPSDWLKRVERTGFGAGLFGEWRDDRDFVLNDRSSRGLHPGGRPNFGTGSWRARGVALLDYGFEAVVSPKVRRHLPQQLHQGGPGARAGRPGELTAPCSTPCMADPTLEITIDVAQGTLEAPAAGNGRRLPARRVHPGAPAERWDDIGLALRSPTLWRRAADGVRPTSSLTSLVGLSLSLSHRPW